MARKRVKSYSKVEDLLVSAVGSNWRVVDIDNRFTSNSTNYMIDDSVKQYVVMNKPAKGKDGKMNDWTNEALMTKILVVDTGEEMRFFDENLVEIQSESIKIV